MVTLVSDETALYGDLDYWRYNNDAPIGTPATVTYWFADAPDPDFLAQGFSDFSPLNQAYRDAV